MGGYRFPDLVDFVRRLTLENVADRSDDFDEEVDPGSNFCKRLNSLFHVGHDSKLSIFIVRR